MFKIPLKSQGKKKKKKKKKKKQGNTLNHQNDENTF